MGATGLSWLRSASEDCCRGKRKSCALGFGRHAFRKCRVCALAAWNTRSTARVVHTDFRAEAIDARERCFPGPSIASDLGDCLSDRLWPCLIRNPEIGQPGRQGVSHSTKLAPGR